MAIFETLPISFTQLNMTHGYDLLCFPGNPRLQQVRVRRRRASHEQDGGGNPADEDEAFTAIFVLAFDDETPIWAITITGLVSAGVCGHLWLLTFGVQLWRDVVSKLLTQ
jgi:hypothetical protein